MSRRPVVVLALTLVIFACGDAAEPGTTLPGPGPDDPLIRIELVGGFAPIPDILSRGPLFTLTAGGKLIFEGPVPAIYPGGLVPNHMESTVTAGELDQLRDLVRRMGLSEMADVRDDSNSAHIADAHTTVITYWDGAGAHRYSVYALGMGMGTPPPASRALAELVGVLETAAYAREAVPYVPERVRVVAGPGTINADFPDLRPWPLEDVAVAAWVEADSEWRCRVFAGDVLMRFRDATQATRWESPAPSLLGDVAQLLVRGLHPGEADCPSS